MTPTPRQLDRGLLLSICIPTHNDAKDLARLLASIEEQWCAGVELVIADNGSTDNTRALVASVAKRIAPVVYTRAPRNQGFDANLRRVVGAAHGKMCWIIGSDDRLYLGAMSRVLDTIRCAPDALIVGDVHVCARDGTPIKAEPSTTWPDYSTFWLDDPGGVAHYLSKVTTVRAAFPFLSNIVFPRKHWPADAMAWEDSGYTHLYNAWRMVLDGVPIVTRRKMLVWCAVGYHNYRDEETAAVVKHHMENAGRIARLVPPGPDRVALRKAWRLMFQPARIRDLHERCHHEPAWAFIRHGLERMLRGGGST